MNSKVPGLDSDDRGHGGRVTRRRAGIVMMAAVVVVSLSVGFSGAAVASAVTRTTPRPTGPEPKGTLPTVTGDAGVFTFGEVAIPPGQPGQLFVVLARPVDIDGHMPIVVRNNREHTVYDVRVTVAGADASGTEVGVAEYYIPTAGLEPGGWVFGQNAVPAPGLAEATNFQLQLGGSTEPTGFVGLDVTAAHVVDGVIEGTVVNPSSVALSDFILVDVACFDSSTITSYESVMPDLVLSRLGPGQAARFATTKPFDPGRCTAIAVHAIGVPEP
jgi:hypothetical protein